MTQTPAALGIEAAKQDDAERKNETMTYAEWFNARKRHEGAEGASIYLEITGDEEGAHGYLGVIEFPLGYLLITDGGQYHAICGRIDILTPDLNTAARFLWDEHSKFEAAHT